jgi:hypothetical protein
MTCVENLCYRHVRQGGNVKGILSGGDGGVIGN